MMSLAEKLKKEINLHKDIPWLKNEVVSQVRGSGVFSVICDRHISDVTKFSIPYRYWKPVEEWARKEGFNVYCDCNSYGVKYLCISL